MTIVSDIKLVTLEETRVISFHGYGTGPEDIAWQKLRNWIVENDAKTMAAAQRFFGFNNPNPAPGSDQYGYEQWMTLPADYQPREGEVIKTLAGGLYAVGGFRASTPESFGPAWQRLMDWRIDSDYAYDESRPWLEELLTKESVFAAFDAVDFDCYMPVIKTGA